MSFPQTRTGEDQDDFFGTTVTDEYRWLEDQNSDEVATWVKAQAELADAYLATLPGRKRLAARLDELLELPTSTAPVPKHGRWFRFTNDGTQQQAVYRVSDAPMGEGTVLIDPLSANPDGTTSIASVVPDPSGQLVAWSYKEVGSDWCRWRVRDVETGTDLSDELNWGKFVEPVWLGDSSGFIWAAYPADESDAYSAANTAPKLLLHTLGTDPAEDRLLFHRPEQAGLYAWPWVDRDAGWLLVLLTDSDNDVHSLLACDLTDPADELHEIVPPTHCEWTPVGADERGFILWTDLDAERGRLVAVDRRTGAISTVVAQREHRLEAAEAIEDGFVLSWLVDACSQVTVHDKTGAEIGRIELPGLGSVTEISTGRDSRLVHLGYTAFGTPPAVLAHDLDSGLTSTVFAPRLDGPELVTDQIWVTSKDGTRLPAFVVHRSDVTAENGPHPTVLYGYGGFYVSQSPTFSPGIATWAEAGGAWVVATLRGGGEYGSAWHDAGRLAKKQNVFDDAIATAETLIELGWTTSEQLAANGGSNGGLLAGALVTQRPDLFAAVVPQVGVLDMLHYEQFTIGRAWARDYGIATRSKEEFDYLYAYSPLHNVRPGTAYPPILLMTSDHDDRVVPAHTFKFGARLQSVLPDDAIGLIRVTYGAGHGQGKSRATQLAERTDLLAFVAAHTGLAI